MINLFLLALHSTSASSQKMPDIEFSHSWPSKVSEYAMHYSSASLGIRQDRVFVLNGGGTGNEIVKFTQHGEFVEKFPGWYNWPMDMVLGEGNELLLSAIGAMGDDHSMRFGMVMYNSSGEFYHGYHQNQTGLNRPYGLAILNKTVNETTVAVCDWDNNQTRLLKVNWDVGSLEAIKDVIISVPYPLKIDTREDRLVVSSMVCCEPWHQPLIKVSLFTVSGVLLGEVKELPGGEVITSPETVAFDPVGNILVVDTQLNKTLLFDPELTYLGDLPALAAPRSIRFSNKQVYTILQVGEDLEDHVMVYNYT